jgi:hypothetical protein
MLFVVQDGLSRPRLCRPARPRVLYTRPPRSIPHDEPIALRQLQRRHPHQPPRYQSGALLLHELCPRVQSRGCIADCLTQKTSAYLARNFYKELKPRLPSPRVNRQSRISALLIGGPRVRSPPPPSKRATLFETATLDLSGRPGFRERRPMPFAQGAEGCDGAGEE